MKIVELPIEGAFKIISEPVNDSRGYFKRLFCIDTFSKHADFKNLRQTSLSFNKSKGTFRGFHYQVSPHEEQKLVTCIQGHAIDYVLDLRRDSKTFKHLEKIDISDSNNTSVFIPRGCAHGFITLKDDTTLIYHIDTDYSPQHARGIRYNDPFFNISIPFEIRVISEKDLNFSLFEA